MFKRLLFVCVVMLFVDTGKTRNQLAGLQIGKKEHDCGRRSKSPTLSDVFHETHKRTDGVWSSGEVDDSSLGLLLANI